MANQVGENADNGMETGVTCGLISGLVGVQRMCLGTIRIRGYPLFVSAASSFSSPLNFAQKTHPISCADR